MPFFTEKSLEQLAKEEEEKKMIDEGAGDPRYEHFAEQSGMGTEKEKPFEVPKGEHPFDKLLKEEQKNADEIMHPLKGLKDETIDNRPVA